MMDDSDRLRLPLVANLTERDPFSRFLVMTGLVGAPPQSSKRINRVLVRMWVRITDGDACVDECWAWDGEKTAGTNQYPSVYGPDKDGLCTAGRGDWGFWSPARLGDKRCGVAVRFHRLSGCPRVEVIGAQATVVFD